MIKKWPTQRELGSESVYTAIQRIKSLKVKSFHNIKAILSDRYLIEFKLFKNQAW